MNNYKLYINNMFRTTIKGIDEDDIIHLALDIYGYDCDIRVVKL